MAWLHFAWVCAVRSVGGGMRAVDKIHVSCPGKCCKSSSTTCQESKGKGKVRLYWVSFAIQKRKTSKSK